MISSDTAARIENNILVDHLTGTEVINRLNLVQATPANQAAAIALLAKMNYSNIVQFNINQRLIDGCAGDRQGAAGAELSSNIVNMIAVLQAQAAGNNVVAVAAHGTLATTAPVIVTSVATGTARNGNTFTLNVSAAAANPTNTVLATFSGTAAAIILTIVPNDGTNNSATPVNVTSAQLVQLINSGTISGESVTLSDTSSLRALQTSSGGAADILVHSGNGDGDVATFAGGAAASNSLIAPALAKFGGKPMSSTTYSVLVNAITFIPAANEFQTVYNNMVSAINGI